MKSAFKSTHGTVLTCASSQDSASAIQNSERQKEGSKLFPGR